MTDTPTMDSALLQSLLPLPLAQALAQPSPAQPALEEGCTRLYTALNALLPFVPAPVASLQLAHPDLQCVGNMSLVGTVVFVDLSGFTALSSSLASAGRSGSEETGAVLNQLFSVLLERVEARGGGLLKMNSDALTAFFDAAHLGPGHAAQACAAALEMQDCMRNFAQVPTSKGTFRLQLRIAIHSGKLFAAQVGDQTHAELMMTGRTINRVAVAQESAAPGEIIISDETLQALRRPQAEWRLTGLHRLNALAVLPTLPPACPAPWTPSPPSQEALVALLERIRALRPYLPYDLPNRFAQPSAVGGEFRPVTVMFISFYAFTRLLAILELPALMERDTAIVGQVLNTYYTSTQAVIQHYGGTINTVDMATLGNRMMALFGAPASHEDDPARAVRAALELRNTFEDTNNEIAGLLREWIDEHPEHRSLMRVVSSAFRQRIGVATGNVFAGIVGTPRRHEYTVVGETVHLAARMMTAADDGEVLLSAMTQRAIEQRIESQPLPAVLLKGIAQSVPVFRAMRERETVERASEVLRNATPLIGRASELGQLQQLASTALRHGPQAGQVVAITSDAGMGKTRLCEELIQSLGQLADEAKLVRDACQSYEQTSAYASVARLLRQLLLHAPHADRVALVSIDRHQRALAVAQQIAGLVPEWGRFAPLLGPLLNLPIPESELTLALTAEQRRHRLHDLIAMLCLALAREAPLVLLVDDLQWADASSLTLIGRLAEELSGTRLLLLLSYRPTAELAEPWRALPHCTQLALVELPRADCEQLLAALLGGPPPASLLPLIDRAGGTPFFLEETVRYLLDSGELYRSQAQWSIRRPLEQLHVPMQIEQLLMARLDRLDEETRTLAQVAAVIGLRFSERLLAAILPRRNARTQRLRDLVDAGILVPDQTGTEPTYRFKQALIHDVTYESMLFANRHSLHQRVAEAIEQLYANEIDDQHGLLAQHYLRAQLPERAFSHLVLAAHQAQVHYANAEAIALYQQALDNAPWADQGDALPDLTIAAPLYESLGDVLAVTGDYAGARQQYEWLLGMLLVGAPDWLVQQAALQRKIGSTYENQGSLEQALTWLHQAAGTLAPGTTDCDATLEQARILSDTGWVHYRQDTLDTAEQCLALALDLVAPLAAYDEQARIQNRLGGLAWGRGDMSLAQRYVEQSLQVSTQSGNLSGQASALNNLSVLASIQGNIDEAIGYCEQSIAINQQIGSRRELAIAAINIGVTLYDYEKYDQARIYLQNALAQATEIRDTFHRMLVLLNLGMTLSALGELDQAEDLIEQSLFIAHQLHLNDPQIEAYIVLADIALQRGALDEALAEYAHCQSIAPAPDTDAFGKLQRLAAKLAFAQGDLLHAIELLEANHAFFTALQNVPESRRTLRLLEQYRNADGELQGREARG